MFTKRFFATIFVLTLMCLMLPRARAQTRAYTTIQGVTITPLSNGVQIKIQADGILQYRDADTGGKTMGLFFPDARNGTGKNFFNINKYPVSYVQLSTPQNAANGIGLTMKIQNFVETSASVSTGSDAQSVMFTVQSNRTVATTGHSGGDAGAADTSANAPDTSTKIDFAKGLLSLRAVRADIHELMGAIAQKTGLSIAVDDAVDRKVGLNLKEVEPAQAVRSIATAYGLALLEVNGILMMSEGVPTDLATYHLSGTQSFRIQNTQAATASGLLPNFLFSYVKVNPEQNAVVVTAPSQMLAKIGQDLQKVDTPAPQIAIEAIAVELSDSKDLNVGLTLGNQPSGSFSSLDVPGGTISYNTIGTLPRNFQATLTALELKGKARVRARPQMAVLNGRTADIFIGAQRFILTQFNQYGQTQTRIQTVDVGVKLSVTPLTGGNGEITTTIAPEVSNITELDLQTSLPVLSTRRAGTTVRVKDGETIAIGGLTLNQEQTSNGRIPILSKFPLIGRIFRSRKRNTVQTELVVFITPRILPNTDAAPTTANTPATATTPTAPVAPITPATPTAPANAG